MPYSEYRPELMGSATLAPTGEIEQVATPTDGTVRYDNELIRASAGTGKTFHLSNRYLRLVLNDVPVSGILATTFTRQAAREILDRMSQRRVVTCAVT